MSTGSWRQNDGNVVVVVVVGFWQEQKMVSKENIEMRVIRKKEMEKREEALEGRTYTSVLGLIMPRGDTARCVLVTVIAGLCVLYLDKPRDDRLVPLQSRAPSGGSAESSSMLSVCM